MLRLRHASLTLLVLALPTACGGPAVAATADFVGSWKEVGDKEHGIVLEFDGKSDKFLLHGPGPGGHSSHDHFAGTYRVDAGEVVLTGAWESNHKAEVRRGRLAAGSLTVDFEPELLLRRG